MNLSVSSIGINTRNIVNFKMAKFTNSGYCIAGDCGKQNEQLEYLKYPHKYNEFQNPEFFKRVCILKPAFTKYAQKKLNEPDRTKASDDIVNAIIQCGTSDNQYANAMFIKQLIATRKVLESNNDTAGKAKIALAIAEVFKKNWDNSILTKSETMTLLEMIKTAIDLNQLATLTGVVQRSDDKVAEEREIFKNLLV